MTGLGLRASGFRSVVVCGVLLLAASPALADRISVRVVDVAGNTAFVEPGSTAGLVRGSKVVIHGHAFKVTDSTEKSAAIALGRERVAVGETGAADVEPGAAAEDNKKLPPPRPLSAFKDQWPATEVPAASQQVKLVPLGGAIAGGGRAHLAIFGQLFGNLDPKGSGGQLEARVVGSFEHIGDRPFGADVDAGIRLFGDGFDTGSRTPLFVYAAQVRYGDPADPALMVGRLRYAATALGMLDGGRVSAHVGQRFELAAFGGLLPDAVSGAPSINASEFGVEAIYDGATSSWHPHVAASMHGTTWKGALDERRLNVTASANHGSTWLDGWLEAQQFDGSNPWGAPSIDLTGAGVTAEWRRRGSHVGVDLTFLRPERSLRLEDALPSLGSPAGMTLPSDWTCARKPMPGAMPETCVGEDFWAAATFSAGTAGRWWRLDAVGSLGQSQGIAVGGDSSGYIRGELGNRYRLVLAASGGKELYSAWMAADIGVAVSPTPTFDASLTYRPEQLDYQASLGGMSLNSLVADARWSVSPRLDLAVSALGTTGADREVLDLLTTIAWRPL